MPKPRHHTLQGICQDLCVNYQQVVEVLRRIRAVCLEENGKVITQEAGTFFCRTVRGRSGVLNGVPWTSEPFIELGLKGERVLGEHAPEETSLSFESVVLRNSVGFTNFEGLPFSNVDPFYTELNFAVGGEVMFKARNADGVVVAESVPEEITRVPFNDETGQLVEGFNNVQISLIPRIDNTGPPVGLGVISIGGVVIARDDLLFIEPQETIALSSTPSFDDLFFELRQIGYQIQFVFGTAS